MKRNSYLAKEKKLKRLLKCDKIFLSKNLCLLDVDVIKKGKKHSYIINPKGIYSNSDDKKTNDLVVEYNDLLIDLANHKGSDDEVRDMLIAGYSTTWIQMYTSVSANQTTRVKAKLERERKVI